MKLLKYFFALLKWEFTMPRPPRYTEYSEINMYHVAARGNKKKKIFYDDEDRGYMEFLLMDSTKNLGGKVHAYCLMDNHIHIMLESKHENISKIMKSILQRYAQTSNKKYSNVGHVFQNRHLSKAINDKQYLKTLAAYIHLNPVRAGMVKNPEEFKWCSHVAYLNKRKIPWVNKNTILQYFKTPKAFHNYVLKTADINSSEFKEIIFDKSLLNSPDIVYKLLTKIEKHTSKYHGEIFYKKLLIKVAINKYSIPISKVSEYLKIHRTYVARIAKTATCNHEQEKINTIFNIIQAV